ncbi:MAG: DUF6498-containing protein [Flavobacteriales bacterium]
MQLISRIHRLDFLTTVVFTFLGLVYYEITVFYLIYLFWVQELIRTIFDTFLLLKKSNSANCAAPIPMVFGSYFIMFIYFIFIVVIFGFMANFRDTDLMIENMRVLFFRNVFFDLNIVLFAIEYFFYVKNNDDYKPRVAPFNSRHVILHVSIIIGAFIQMFLLVKLEVEGTLGSALVGPFCFSRKYFFDRPFGGKRSSEQIPQKLEVKWRFPTRGID